MKRGQVGAPRKTRGKAEIQMRLPTAPTRERRHSARKTQTRHQAEGAGMEEVLTVPIQLTERVREAVEEADSFRQECADVSRRVETLARMLRNAARVARVASPSAGGGGMYERPMRRIVGEVVKTVEKALALVRKCKRSGILKRVITITSATDFRRVVNQLESSIGDVNWAVNICGGAAMTSLPPIASTDPMLAWVWGGIALLHTGTAEEKEEGANSLASLAADSDRNGKIIIEEGGVAPLLRLLKDAASAPAAQIAAASALGSLSVEQERVAHILREGAVAVLFHVLSDAPMPVQAKVAWALSRMVSSDSHAQEAFAQGGAIRPLVSLLALEETSHGTAGVHSGVALRGRNESSRSDGDHGSRRGSHRREREEEDPALKRHVKTEAARALWKLAENSVSNSRTITDTRALLCFAKLIETEGGELQSHCLMAVMEIAAAAERNPDLRRAAFKTNSPAAKAVVAQLLRIAEEGGNPLLQIPALKAIGCLARTFPARESRVIRPLVRQLGHRDPFVASEAAAALQKFVVPENYLCAEHSKCVIESGGVPLLTRLLKSEEKEAQVPSLMILCHLALHEGNSVAFEHAKALSALEAASRSPIAQLQSLREIIPKAVKHLELYQSGGHPHGDVYDDK